MCVFLPILTYLVFLSDAGEHDDASRIQLPDHPPKVVGGVGQRALRSDISITLQVSLEKMIINKKNTIIWGIN